MKENSASDILTRLIWLAIPLFVGLLVWIVTMTYSTQKDIAIITTKQINTDKLAQDIYRKVDQNNSILNMKADQAENKTEHNALLEKIKAVEDITNRIYIKIGSLAYMKAIDSIHQYNAFTFRHPVSDSSIYSETYE